MFLSLPTTTTSHTDPQQPHTGSITTSCTFRNSPHVRRWHWDGVNVKNVGCHTRGREWDWSPYLCLLVVLFAGFPPSRVRRPLASTPAVRRHALSVSTTRAQCKPPHARRKQDKHLKKHDATLRTCHVNKHAAVLFICFLKCPTWFSLLTCVILYFKDWFYICY